MTAVAALLLVPWVIRNYNDFHRFIPTRTGSGETLWDGLGEYHNSYAPPISDYWTYQEVHRLHPNLVYLSPAYDSYLGGRATAVIKHHPLFYLETIGHRVWEASFGALSAEWMRAGTKTPFTYKGGPLAYALERPLDLLQVVLLPLVFLLAMLSLGFTWSGRRRAHALLIATVGAVLLPYMLLHFEPRYAMPAAFVYLIWIGLGADLLIERLNLWRHDASAPRAFAKRVTSNGSA